MAQNDKIQLFEDKRVRTAWDEEKEEWYFSVVDVVAVLTNQPDQRHAAKYWSVLKTRLRQEVSELPTNCSQLKMTAAHRAGVKYAILTDEITRAWSGMSTRQYKNLKGLKKENLRDNMTTRELVLNMLAEAATMEISQQRPPETFSGIKRPPCPGGR